MTRELLTRLLETASVQNAAEITDRLFAKYHSLDGIFCADAFTLENMIGERASMLVKLAAALSSRRDTEKLRVGDTYDPVLTREFLVALFRGCAVEMVYSICFDAQRRVLSVDLVGEGTVNSANVTPRKLVDIAVKNRATSVVIAHNHPGGSAIPSRQDINFTSSVREMLASAGVNLMAHYAVAASSCRKI